jgi:hypothetical protein
MKRLLILIVLSVAAATTPAGIIDNIVFRDNGFGARLNASARLMSKEEAVAAIQATTPAKVNTNSPPILCLTIQNTNNVTVWGSGRIVGTLVNEPFSFAVGANQTYRMMIISNVLWNTPGTNDVHLRIEWKEIFKK